MILSNAQAHQTIQRLQRELRAMEEARYKAEARVNELERQIAERDKTIQKIYRECFL